MKEIKNLGNLYNQSTRWGIYDENGISPCITASMGMGGGHIPMVIDKSIYMKKEILKKSPCLHGFENGTNGQLNKQLAKGGMVRRLTPIECERLQTVKDNYTKYVSDSQRYKMLGNGWTVDVIAHIFSYLKN